MITHNKIGYNGRLGNQLFIYATLISLREKLGVEIGIPETNCNNIINTSYDMYHNFWVQSNCKLFDYFYINCNKTDNQYPITYTEPKHGYNSELYILQTDLNISIDGYFQSWKYFHEYKSIVKNELRFKDEMIKNVKDRLNGIENKIAIHIRLGDALAHSNIYKLTPEYISSILSEFDDKNYNYIIFSDNFEYIKDWFPEDSSVHIMNYNEIESLYLMTQCDHFIISPSTFSWWGAYLGEKQDSRVYSPDWWFNDGRDLDDLILKHWIKYKAI